MAGSPAMKSNSSLKKALLFREENTFIANTKDDFIKHIDRGGFVYAHWDGTAKTEELIKQKTKATIRCIPLSDQEKTTGNCLFTGMPSKQRVLFAKAY